jgi:hypothetical protein
MGKSDFREDRDWNLDLPHIDDVKTVRQQYEYQRILRKKWDALANRLPSDIMELPFPEIDAPWWQHPDGLPPEYFQRQQERYLKRQRNGR